MGSVVRAEYMDNIKVAEVTETIQRERAYGPFVLGFLMRYHIVHACEIYRGK
jgi:hypothetical protein